MKLAQLKPLERPIHPLMLELREIVIGQPVKQEMLAERAGYTSCAVSEWFSGRRTPRIHSITDLANALGYDVVLVKRSNPRSSHTVDRFSSGLTVSQ